MKTSRPSFSPARHQDLNTRIVGYTKLGAAVLVTAATVAGMASAEAQAITTLTSDSFGGSLPSAAGGHTTPFSIGGYNFELTLVSSNTGATHHGRALLRAADAGAPGILSAGGHHGFAKSAVIGPVMHGSGNPLIVASTGTTGYSFRSGMFLPTGANAAVTGYVGLKLVNGGNNYYGWLRVSVTNAANGFLASISLKGDEAGIAGAYAVDSIKAGQTVAAPVPEPGQVATGLGLFALGAAGVREYRRRKQQAAA